MNANETVKHELKKGETVNIRDLDGVVKDFTVASVNRVTYTIVHRFVSPKWGKQSIPRSLRKDNWKITK